MSDKNKELMLKAILQITNAITKTVSDSYTAGHEWPSAATHALLSNKGNDNVWGAESEMEFFLSHEDLLDRLEELLMYQMTWGTKRSIAYQIYEWNFGPILKQSRNAPYLFPTKAEKESNRSNYPGY